MFIWPFPQNSMHPQLPHNLYFCNNALWTMKLIFSKYFRQQALASHTKSINYAEFIGNEVCYLLVSLSWPLAIILPHHWYCITWFHMYNNDFPFKLILCNIFLLIFNKWDSLEDNKALLLICRGNLLSPLCFPKMHKNF
jgi:hypothetical protein